MMRNTEDMLKEIETANGGEGPEPIRSVDGEVLRAIAAAAETRDTAQAAVAAAVARARDAGASWTAIGAMLGVTRQAAIKRYSAGRRSSVDLRWLAGNDEPPAGDDEGPDVVRRQGLEPRTR